MCIYLARKLSLCLVLSYTGSCVDFRFLCARVLHGGSCLMPSMKTLRYSSFNVSSCSHTSELLATLVPTAFGFTVCKHTERRRSITSDTQSVNTCQWRDLSCNIHPKVDTQTFTIPLIRTLRIDQPSKYKPIQLGIVTRSPPGFPPPYLCAASNQELEIVKASFNYFRFHQCSLSHTHLCCPSFRSFVVTYWPSTAVPRSSLRTWKKRCLH